ncbi:MAG: substrate-binding domain-containing protein [Spirochaetales bacterium]|nr:substrate-binding domain-containing protein [Spirochaetales bacterium]
MKLQKIGLIMLVLMIVSATFVFAGGQQDGGEKQLHIGVAAASFDDKWMSYMHEGFEIAAEEAGVKITMVDGKNDSAVQQGQIDTFITMGVDAIILVPCQIQAMAPILDETEAAGIPVVAVNRLPAEPELSRLATFVGSNEEFAGTVQGEAIADLLGGKGDVVIIHGQLGHPAEQGRTRGNMQIFDQYPDINVVLEGTSEWQRAKALQLMENWIQKGTNIDAVVANNDESAIGAAMALEQVGMLDDVFIAGVDATPDALQFLKAGKIDVTVFQDAYGQGFACIGAAIAAVNGEELPKITDIPFLPVTLDKVDEFIAKWE